MTGALRRQGYPELVRSVERLAVRTLPRMPEDPGEFPRDTKKRLEALAKESRLEEALAVKDLLVWELLQGRKQAEAKLIDEQVDRPTTADAAAAAAAASYRLPSHQPCPRCCARSTRRKWCTGSS